MFGEAQRSDAPLLPNKEFYFENDSKAHIIYIVCEVFEAPLVVQTM
jgi:hypothetical protein